MFIATKIPKYIKLCTPEELHSIFDGKTKSYLMRSIILNEKEHYRRTQDSRTLRGVWYSVVKPTLDKLGYLTADDSTEAGLTRWDATLSKYMADLLRRGMLMYSDLGIIDTSRRKETPAERYAVASIQKYGYKINVAPYSNIIIATEKDTVFNIISKMAQLFGCSCISAKGQNALGAMETLIKNIHGIDHPNRKFDSIYILSMTDYDPAGYYIAGALKKQAEDILEALNIHDVDVIMERIGIEPDQLSDELVEQNKYSPKPANLDAWVEMTGGINGEAKGLELDALSPDQLREIFVESIREYVDPELYQEFVERSYAKKQFLEAMMYVFDQASEEFYDQYRNEIEVDDLDVFELAQNGRSSVPVSDYCSGLEGFDDVIKDIMIKVINDEE